MSEDCYLPPPQRVLFQDDAEKCVSCIKSGMKYCQYGEGAYKCCSLLDFSPNCQLNCSNQLISNSFYSQYRVCPQRELACGERYLNATYDEQYMQSSAGDYRKNITCVYHISNPWPDNPMYFTIYRVRQVRYTLLRVRNIQIASIHLINMIVENK